MSEIDRYTCEEAFQRLDDYLDRELAPAEAGLVRRHLDVCEVCAREHTFEASVLDQVRAKLQRIAVPPELAAKISRALSLAEGK